MNTEELPLKGDQYFVFINHKFEDGKYGDTYRGRNRNNAPVAIKHFTFKGDDTLYHSCMDLTGRKDNKQNRYLLPYLDYIEGWLVMEYCNQCNLSDYLMKHPEATIREKLTLMRQCADAIACLHASEPVIVHTSIKPQNILVKRKGNEDIIQISDYFSFSLLDQQCSNSSANTSSGSSFLIEEYFKAPESFMKLAKKESSVKNKFYDIFSLGLVYYAMLKRKDDGGNLKPLITGRTDPIGFLFERAERKKVPKFVLYQDTEYSSNIQVKELQHVIEKMLVLKDIERLSASTVLQELQRIESEYTRRDISRKFYQLLLERGPCPPTCDKILELFRQLANEELRIVMAKGSIEIFLADFSDIILIENGYLHAKESIQEVKHETEPIKYDSFIEKLQKDTSLKELVQDFYSSPSGAIIYVATEKENKAKVDELLMGKYPDLKFKSFCPSDDDYRLLMNEDRMVNVDKCIGPGSFIFKDDGLQTHNQHRGHRTNDSLHDVVSENGEWGSIGCFARNPSDQNVYVLSAKHIVTEKRQHSNDHKMQLVSGFEQKHNVIIKRGVRNQEIEVQVQDLVYLAKGYRGYHGKRRINNFNVMVDIALFGPLSNAMLDNHESFLALQENHIKVNDDFNIADKIVMKYGAKTGFTKGLILEAKSEKYGTFIVGSIDDNYKLCDVGQFADEGDSGSIVLLADTPGSLVGLGIVHGKKETYIHYKEGKKVALENVICCCYLNHCINALDLGWQPELYYHNFPPKLCLGQQ